MGQVDLLRYAVRALEAAGVAYMITGSYASSLQGQPRDTHDIDLVVELRPPQVATLLSAFPEDRYYYSREAVQAAVRDLQMVGRERAAAGRRQVCLRGLAGPSR